MKKILGILKIAVLISCSLIAIFPFYWMVTTAFSETVWISDPQLLPIPLYWGALRSVLTEHPFVRWMLNSTVVATAGTLGNLFLASMAAFAFSCLRFRGRDLIFYILLSTMMIPPFLMIVPQYFVMNKFGWLNTYWGAFVPSWFNMFSVFLLRQYYLSIPQDTLNAARIDGANLWQIYWKIILSSGKSILMVLFVIRFLFNWNTLLWPVIVLRSAEMQTLTIGMSQFYDIYQSEFNKIMAGSVVSLIPIFVLFIVFQKYVEKGLRVRITF